MNRVVVTAFARPHWLDPCLQALRQRAVWPLDITVAIDGDREVDWHAVAANQRIAERLADRVVLLGRHAGNGPTFAAGLRAGSCDAPVMKCDQDVIPRFGYDVGLVSAARAYDDGRLVGLAAILPRWDPTNVGLRRPWPGQRWTIMLAVFTPGGIRLLGDQATETPINGHEHYIKRAARTNGYWYAYTERAQVDIHLGRADLRDEPYSLWKRQYL